MPPEDSVQPVSPIAAHRRSEIAAHATRLFAEKGYDATSIYDICGAAGIGRGLLYHYFKSKEEILRVIHEHALRPLYREQLDAYEREEDPRTTLRTFSRNLLRKMCENIDESIVWARETRALRDDTEYWKEAIAARAATFEMLESTIERGMSTGLFRKGDIKLTALAWLNLHNASYTWLKPGGRLTPDQVSDIFMDIFLAGVEARTGEPL